MILKFRKIILVLILAPVFAMGQSTFTSVYNLLQTNCNGSGCHDGNTPNIFSVDAPDSVVYYSLVNVNPENAAALAKGDKLVAPGYVDRSFLLRKIAHGLNENNIHLSLTQPQEGSPMPDSLSALNNFEIELIRQWILYGAPLTGNVVDTAVINMYYRGKGKDDTYPYHSAPAPGTGFQIYVGKLFIPAQTELTLYLKHNLKLPTSIEIPKIVTMLPSATHHFIILKYLPGGSTGYAEGVRLGEVNSSHANVSDGIGTGPNLMQYELPANTAYFWEQSTILDFNLHVRNSMSDTVIATDIYVNVFTQPVGTAQKNMLIRNFPIESIVIPPDSVQHEFIEIARDTNETKYWNIWLLYGHTHKYGKDYDIFLRNSDGTMGEQQYESWISYEQGGIYAGFHRFGVDGTYRFYPDDALLQVDPRLGFIHRARYLNNTSDTVRWGFTSEEEMMVMGFQYVYGDDLAPLSVEEVAQEDIKLKIFPNPVSNALALNYILEHASDIKVELTNVLGESISVLEQKSRPAGNYLEEIDLDKRFASGVYLLRLHTKNVVTTRKVVIE